MPFTEKDLRAMLEDNSSDLPPTGDLAASAQERGRRVRRRRQAAGAVAAAALVAVGIAVVPSLGTDDGPRSPEVLAAYPTGSSPASPASRPDVDLSLLKKLKKGEFPFALDLDSSIRNLKFIEPGEAREPAIQTGTIDAGRIDYLLVSGLHALSITGTVEGFTLAPEPFSKKHKYDQILMKVRLGTQLDDSPEFQRRGLREGETVDLLLGSVKAGADPTGLLSRAIPAGARILTFEGSPPQMAGYFDFGRPRPIQNLVLEDSDGTLTGVPYTNAEKGGPDPDPMASPPSRIWKKAKTFDDLLGLVQNLWISCPTVYAFSDREVDPKEMNQLMRSPGRPAHFKCLTIGISHRKTPPGQPMPFPTLQEDPTAVPTPSPGSPENPTAPQEPSPTPS